jgi:Protein of unknown function (DUF2958)
MVRVVRDRAIRAPATKRNFAMTLITQAQLDQLLANGRAQRSVIDNDQGALDFKPVVKLFSILCLAGLFGLSMPSPGDGESEA